MGGKIRIRNFIPGDAKHMLDLHQQSSKYFEDLGISREFILNIAHRSDYMFLVAESGGRLLGFIGVLYYSHVGRGEIGPVCVELNYRGEGIGSMLLDEALAFLGSMGISRVIARVKKMNMRGMQFFEINGFRREGCFLRYTKQGEDVIQLVRFI
ncbi:MAG: hypothetical protein B6U97_01350 [Candidatus Altiarchaeales archaeon ex4484_96]|nr:MAG: hypothetical protein B6U97_01350 [Candidatus Altiarchaeales archaeon ex4484_96]